MKIKLDTQGEERKHVNNIIMAVLPCCKPKLGDFTSLYDQASTPLVFPLTTPNTNHETYAKPQGLFGSAQRPVFGLQNYQSTITSPGFGKPVAKYLPPATASAIHYAYLKISERSPLRRLLTDIFAYDVKPEALYEEDSLSFPA